MLLQLLLLTLPPLDTDKSTCPNGSKASGVSGIDCSGTELAEHLHRGHDRQLDLCVPGLLARFS